jgi:hypothetical protein
VGSALAVVLERLEALLLVERGRIVVDDQGITFGGGYGTGVSYAPA